MWCSDMVTRVIANVFIYLPSFETYAPLSTTYNGKLTQNLS
jgi:hypothetical protein